MSKIAGKPIANLGNSSYDSKRPKDFWRNLVLESRLPLQDIKITPQDKSKAPSLQGNIADSIFDNNKVAMAASAYNNENIAIKYQENLTKSLQDVTPKSDLPQDDDKAIIAQQEVKEIAKELHKILASKPENKATEKTCSSRKTNFVDKILNKQNSNNLGR